jgi:hypothetical protein
VRPLSRSLAGIVVWTVTGRFERAVFKALDGAFVSGEWFAYRLSNTPPVFREARRGEAVGLVAVRFPALEDPAVAQARAAHPAAVEAAWRPVRVDREAARTLPIAWAEDDGTLRRWGAVARLAARRPAAVARYATGRNGGPPLRDVAGRALRMAEAGVREVRAAGPDAERDAAAIVALLGVARG